MPEVYAWLGKGRSWSSILGLHRSCINLGLFAGDYEMLVQTFKSEEDTVKFAFCMAYHFNVMVYKLERLILIALAENRPIFSSIGL